MRLATNVMRELWFETGMEPADQVAASRSLAARLAAIEGLKTFPAVAQRILELMNFPDYEVAAVERVLNEDPALASQILRIANSAAFRVGRDCETIAQAVIRLGSQNLLDIVLGLATMGLFRDIGGLGMRIRNHSAGVAVMARGLAREFNPKFVAGAFLAGLLHDVGRLLIIEAGEIDYAEYSEEELAELQQADVAHERERELLGYDHAVLGGHVLALWRIPEPIPRVVAWHHQPARADKKGERFAPFVALVRLADLLDHAIESGEPTEKAIAAVAASEQAAKVGATLPRLTAIWDKLLTAREESRAMFA